jgi:hypothetical protein
VGDLEHRVLDEEPNLMRTIRDLSSNRYARHAIRAFAVAIIGATLSAAAISPAAAEENYVNEAEVTFALYDGKPDQVTVPGLHKENANCRGTLHIGQTADNSIQATSSVTCKKTVAVNRNYVAIHTDSPNPLASNDNGCDNCRTYTIATSIRNAVPGTRYCALGMGTTGLKYSNGGGNVCITA